MKKLSIIIPYHNEDEEKITPMFSSLDAQFNVDWSSVEILISNDHNSPKNMTDFFKLFPKVNQVLRYLQCPVHIGPGPNRQYAIDNSSGEYIMFLDADDELTRGDALNSILNSVDSNDVYLSKILLETPESGGKELVISEANHRFLHGKIIKREFLEHNSIKFNHKLRIFEDSYYCALLYLHNPSLNETIPLFYRYKFNQDSVSRFNLNGGTLTYCAKDWLLSTICVIESLQDSINVDKYEPIKFYLGYISNRYAEYKTYTGEAKDIADDQIKYIVSSIDPTLKLALSMDIAPTGDTPYKEWLKNIVKNVDRKAIEKKYGFSPTTIKPYTMD